MLHLNQGGRIRVSMAFALSDVERARIATMRVEGARRRSSNPRAQVRQGRCSSLTPPGGLRDEEVRNPQQICS